MLQALLLGVAWSQASLAFAQTDASPPGERRVTLGGEALASIATGDAGHFNFSSYGQSSLRLARARLDASLRLGPRAALLAEARVDNGGGPSVSALYLRVHPWRDRAVDAQVGRIPPVFGAFVRRGYGADNPLMGVPLPYQYLTSVRADSVPSSADDLLRQRGRGWHTNYPVGAATIAPGLPLVAGDRWDTGAEIRIGREPVAVSAAITQGTPSNPRLRDDNDGKQLSGRVEVRPRLGLVLGASAARGEFLSRDVVEALPPAARDRAFHQRALGADAEYSRAHWQVRAEALLSSWTEPPLGSPAIDDPLRAWGVFVEGRYRFHPRLYGAARVEHLGFSRLASTLYDGRSVAWDAPVSRIEIGAGYSLRRRALLKATLQHDRRSRSAIASETILGAQALVWF